MKKATINVVAEYAGVSKKTVSRVLNNEPNVSDKTTEKVKAAFEALSYKPSTQARGLATNQSYLIGLIYDNPNKDYISEIQTGALNLCHQVGYNLIIHPADFQSKEILDNLRNFIAQSQLDGLVLTPPFSDMQSLLNVLDEHDINYVRIAPTNLYFDSICVTNNDQEISYKVTQYLISLGHQKIGFIKGHPQHNVSKQRFNGFQQAMSEAGLEVHDDYVTEGLFDFDSGEICAKQLLALRDPPTAIFASNDYMAAGVLKVANMMNISVPKQLSVTGFDDAAISRHTWPSITTVQQPVKIMAYKALELLVKQIRKEHLEHTHIQLDNTFLERESCAVRAEIN